MTTSGAARSKEDELTLIRSSGFRTPAMEEVGTVAADELPNAVGDVVSRGDATPK